MPSPAEPLSIKRGPKLKEPNCNGPIFISSQEGPDVVAFGNSWGDLIGNSEKTSEVGRNIDKDPTQAEKIARYRRGLHQILGDKKLKKVIINKARTKPTLQNNPESIGEIKKNKTQPNFIRGSIRLSQLELPKTYCPIGIFFKKSIYNI